MLRILMKTASSMGKSGGSVSAERYDESDLSTWELVNASHSDDEDRYSFDGEDVTSDSDGVIGSDEPSEEAYELARAAREFISAVDVISIQPMSISPPMTRPVEMTLSNHVYLEDDDDEHEQDDDDDGDDDDAGEYDDELVPWKLKGRFGKQRIMKLGKRGPKPNKAKRMPIWYNRPGILYGKQGFGVQHSGCDGLRWWFRVGGCRRYWASSSVTTMLWPDGTELWVATILTGLDRVFF